MVWPRVGAALSSKTGARARLVGTPIKRPGQLPDLLDGVPVTGRRISASFRLCKIGRISASYPRHKPSQGIARRSGKALRERPHGRATVRSMLSSTTGGMHSWNLCDCSWSVNTRGLKVLQGVRSSLPPTAVGRWVKVGVPTAHSNGSRRQRCRGRCREHPLRSGMMRRASRHRLLAKLTTGETGPAVASPSNSKLIGLYGRIVAASDFGVPIISGIVSDYCTFLCDCRVYKPRFASLSALKLTWQKQATSYRQLAALLAGKLREPARPQTRVSGVLVNLSHLCNKGLRV